MNVGQSIFRSHGPARTRPLVGGLRNQFSPLNLANLELWLDASDSGSVFADQDGTVLASPNGMVRNWRDKSGKARHVTQSDLATLPVPIWQPTANPTQNNRPVLDFDGVDDLLNLSAMPTIASAITIAGVLKLDSTATLRRVLSRASGTNGPSWQIDSASSFPNLANPGAADGLGNVSFGTTNFRVLVSTYDGSQVRHFLDGAGAGTIARTWTFSQPITTVGSGFSNPFDGRIGEIIVISRAIQDSERQRLEQYLRSKWGTA